ncbi:MAG TPA: hypothetical protein VJR50_09150 [Mycobacterium sp.]|nr:hypothetical protein [Mycobacterium sp.]
MTGRDDELAMLVGGVLSREPSAVAAGVHRRRRAAPCRSRR